MALIFQINTPLRCMNIAPFPGNKIAPDLTEGAIYKLKQVHTCKCGEVHFDVGLISEVNSVTCYKCREELPKGDVHHWAHSSRFEATTAKP